MVPVRAVALLGQCLRRSRRFVLQHCACSWRESDVAPPCSATSAVPARLLHPMAIRQPHRCAELRQKLCCANFSVFAVLWDDPWAYCVWAVVEDTSDEDSECNIIAEGVRSDITDHVCAANKDSASLTRICFSRGSENFEAERGKLLPYLNSNCKTVHLA